MSAYKDRNIALKAPRQDAKSLAELFTSLAKDVYRKTDVVVFTDKEASSKNVLRSFQDILGKARPNDAVVVFFAGHGIIEKGKYFFLPYEADITDVEGSSLSIDDMNAFVKNWPLARSPSSSTPAIPGERQRP